MSKIKQAFLSLGLIRYTAMMGLGFFGAYMFAVFCFVYKINGLDLSLGRLTMLAIMSIFCGVSWGVGSWYLIYRKAP